MTNRAPVFFTALSLFAISVCCSTSLHAQQAKSNAVAISFRVSGDTGIVAANKTAAAKAESAQTPTITISPNPAKDRFQIRLNIEKERTVKLAIYDDTGVMAASLLEGSMPQGLHMMEYPTHDLADGTYVVRLESEGTVTAAKVIVRH
jgi:hypothetical protein